MLVRGVIAPGTATDARRHLRRTLLQLHPFGIYAERIWDLRDNLTVYDAWYVAIAERLRQPLVTADSGILGAPGLRCELIDAR
jgi:predicted nucleic acid-binding protein